LYKNQNIIFVGFLNAFFSSILTQCERRYSYADYWGHSKGVWILFDE